MFYREENPALFDVIAKQYSSFDVKFLINYNQKKVDKMSDDQLKKIVALDLTDSRADIVSLKGIEKLTNLTKLSINGLNYVDYCKLVKVTKIKYAMNSDEKELAENLDVLENLYNKNQIFNLSPLYKLKNLEVLNINNQRHIESIDLSELPNLKKLNMNWCENLQEIKNIDKLKIWNSVDINNAKFDFSGCVKLNKVDEFSKCIDLIMQRKPEKEIMYLPTTTFCFLLNKDNEIAQKIYDDDIKNIIKWCEISGEITKIKNNGIQMLLAKNKIDNIINTICKQDATQLENIYQIYKWVVDNVKYDFNGKKQEDNLTYEQMQELKSDQNAVVNTIRSSLVALWDKKSVCVGISNLLNLMLADIGIVSNIVNCSLKNKKDKFMQAHNYDIRLGDVSHQISSININGYTYYLDPTCELPHKKFVSFLKNKEEILNNYQLIISEYKTKNGMSIQNILKENDLLREPKKDKALDAYEELMRAIFKDDNGRDL